VLYLDDNIKLGKCQKCRWKGKIHRNREHTRQGKAVERAARRTPTEEIYRETKFGSLKKLRQKSNTELKVLD